MKFIEKFITSKKGLKIFTESLGNPANPAIILIMGAMNQGIFWYDLFCEFLSENELFVIRYDHRDTGKSSIIDYDKKPYNLNDLTGDVLDILDSYRIDKAHIAGLSMGGYIAQLMGINYPEKIKSLTLISTTADHRPYMDATMGKFDKKYALPFPEKRFLNYIEKTKNYPPVREAAIFNNQLEGWKVVFNNISDNDFIEIINLVKTAVNRSENKYSAFNHAFAVLNSPARTELLRNIKVPTLIIHGENDPCFPLQHGKFLHELIPDSELEIIEKMGHMFTLTESKIISKKIVDFIK